MAGQERVIITCAVTGSIHTPTMSPYLPLTPEQITKQALEAAEAGAAILHLHARDPKDGRPTSDPAVFMQFLPRIKEGTDATGSRTRVKVVKNKIAPPFRQAEFDILFNEGISREGDILDQAAERGLLEKSGTWYSVQGTRIGQGRENARRFLRENRDLADALAEQVYAHAGLKRPVPATEGAEESG